MNRVKTFFHKFHKRSPRGWAISVFPVFCILTTIGLPIDLILFVFARGLLRSLNFFDDLWHIVKTAWCSESAIHKTAWKIWWKSVSGKDEQSKSDNT